MGWYSGWKSKAALIAELRSDVGAGWQELAHAVVRDGMWRVVQSPKGAKFIRFDLLESYKGDWGYKPMDESMYPYYFDCPLAFLAMAPVASQAWRDKVYEHHGAAPGAAFEPPPGQMALEL